MYAKERFDAVYDTIPRVAVYVAIIIAEYVTPWREVFNTWILDADVRDAVVSWAGSEREAIRTVDIHLRDASGARFVTPLTIHGRLRLSSKKNMKRALLSGRYTIDSRVMNWRSGTLNGIWADIESRSLVNQDALTSNGWKLVNGIETDIIRAALAHWLTKRRKYQVMTSIYEIPNSYED